MAARGRTRRLLEGLALPVRVYLGGVFIFASLYKIQEPYEFALSVATYQISPLSLINIFAIILPWLELLVGIAIIIGFWTRESAFLILGMMVLFVSALAYALAQGHEMTCGCFASQEAVDQIGMDTLIRDLFWIALAVYVFLFDEGRYGVDGLLRRKRSHA
jgi:putative oxidoreductase